ncbi:MAG: hypothetical protein ACJ74T_18580 [Pyrinomonadaceae bacterium]
MKLRAAAAMLLLLACAAARAQDKPVELQDKPVELIDEFVGIRFVPPKGTERLGDEETAREFHIPGARLVAVYVAPKNTMMLAIDVFDAEAYGLPPGLTKDDQQALRQKLESEIMADVPGVKWVSREVIRLNSYPWLRLRYNSSSGDEMAVDEYAIVWAGKLMALTYYCSAENYERLRADFEKSAASFELFLSIPKENVKPAGRRGKRKP